MLQQTLKASTKDKHTLLEELMFVKEIIGGTLSLSQYKQILSTNYLVHVQLEKKLHSLVSPCIALDLKLKQREKTALLKKDFEEVNAILPICKKDDPFTTFATEAAALGALYVLEGATLGGNVIVKKLVANANFIKTGINFHYYKVYGDKLIVFWSEFCHTLNNQPLNTYNQITEGANDMFEYLIYVQKKMLQSPLG